MVVGVPLFIVFAESIATTRTIAHNNTSSGVATTKHHSTLDLNTPIVRWKYKIEKAITVSYERIYAVTKSPQNYDSPFFGRTKPTETIHCPDGIEKEIIDDDEGMVVLVVMLSSRNDDTS